MSDDFEHQLLTQEVVDALRAALLDLAVDVAVWQVRLEAEGIAHEAAERDR